MKPHMGKTVAAQTTDVWHAVAFQITLPFLYCQCSFTSVLLTSTASLRLPVQQRHGRIPDTG